LWAGDIWGSPKSVKIHANKVLQVSFFVIYTTGPIANKADRADRGDTALPRLQRVVVCNQHEAARVLI
jgi:hypothetical protein